MTASMEMGLQSYSCKELNSANMSDEQGGSFFPRASRHNTQHLDISLAQPEQRIQFFCTAHLSYKTVE